MSARRVTDRTVTGRIPPFHRFLEEHRTAVYRFLVSTVGPQEADDCFQETFLSALRAYPELRHAENLRGWVLAIAARKGIDAARARGRRPRPVADVTETLAEHRLAERYARQPEHPVEASDGLLWERVRALPDRQRVAVIHRVLLDRSYPEIASVMATSVEAARANVYQALKKLRERWPDDEQA